VDPLLVGLALGTHLRSLGMVSVVYLVGLALVMHFLLVMFGIPLDREVELTALYAWFLAALSLPRAVGEALPFIGAQHRSLLEPLAIGPAVGACVGGWCGAYFVVLDWDQHWQVFPVASLFCSCIGYLIGALIVLSPLQGYIFERGAKER